MNASGEILMISDPKSKILIVPDPKSKILIMPDPKSAPGKRWKGTKYVFVSY